jgi:hypothetical protein
MTRTLDLDAFLDTLTLERGSHSDHAAMCVMEAVAYVAGEKWSDSPVCASPVIAGFLRSWNDAMNDEDRQQLKPLIPRLVNTRGDEATELRRSYLALDRHCRVSAPTWLRAAGLVKEAERIEALPPLTDKASVKRATQALHVVTLQKSALDLVERMIEVGVA